MCCFFSLYIRVLCFITASNAQHHLKVLSHWCKMVTVSVMRGQMICLSMDVFILQRTPTSAQAEKASGSQS